MTDSEARPLSRRSLLCLATTLALPVGCAGTLPLDIRDVRLDAMPPDHVLLLGRIRLTMLDFDRTGTAFIRTTAGPEERLLPEDGAVAWVVPHAAGAEIRLAGINMAGGWLANPLLLAPAVVPAPLVYFGDVEFIGAAGLDDNRASGEASKLTWKVLDLQGPAMAGFVARNPGLRGRRVYNVLRKATFDTPPVLPVARIGG
jgi:hypothetical protein